MKVLITGGAGFLGQGLIQALEPHHDLCLLDVVQASKHHESIVGSVTDLGLCRELMRGVDAVVIGHMAPRGKGLYASPRVPFEVNVAGTANLYLAAHEAGVRRVVLISSIVVVLEHQNAGVFLDRHLHPSTELRPYGLSKVCQEAIARQYYLGAGIATAILRPGYITDADQNCDKYGRDAIEANWQYIDRRDIGKAAHLALHLADLKCETFFVLGHPDAVNHADIQATRARLGWEPDHTFVAK